MPTSQAEASKLLRPRASTFGCLCFPRTLTWRLLFGIGSRQGLQRLSALVSRARLLSRISATSGVNVPFGVAQGSVSLTCPQKLQTCCRCNRLLAALLRVANTACSVHHILLGLGQWCSGPPLCPHGVGVLPGAQLGQTRSQAKSFAWAIAPGGPGSQQPPPFHVCSQPLRGQGAPLRQDGGRFDSGPNLLLHHVG